MYCIECGSKNADGAKFCTTCGASLLTAQPGGPAEGRPVKEAPPQPERPPKAEPAAAATGKTEASPAATPTENSGAETCIKSIWADLYSSCAAFPAMSMSTGKLSVYPDRLVYAAKFNNILNTRGGFFAQKKTECTYDQIVACSPTKRMKVQTGALLRLRSGETVTFAGNCAAADVETVIRYINLRIHGIEQETPVNARFVLRVRQKVAIPAQGVAAIGRVEKGSVRIGDKVRILRPDAFVKTECCVKSLAVGKAVFEQADQGTDNVALLLEQSVEDVLQPQDLICNA